MNQKSSSLNSTNMSQRPSRQTEVQVIYDYGQSVIYRTVDTLRDAITQMGRN